MRDEGLLTFYKLSNDAASGMKPVEKLVPLKVDDVNVTAYYENRTIGIQRRYMAKGADYQLDRLVRCYNTIVPEEAKYVIMEDLRQYRIEDIAGIVDEGACDLSLERLENYYEVLDESD